MMLISSGEPKGEVAAGLRLLAPLAPARLGRGATCRLAEQREDWRLNPKCLLSQTSTNEITD